MNKEELQTICNNNILEIFRMNNINITLDQLDKKIPDIFKNIMNETTTYEDNLLKLNKTSLLKTKKYKQEIELELELKQELELEIDIIGDSIKCNINEEIDNLEL